MNIISIDVGCRNLAYCIINIEKAKIKDTKKNYENKKAEYKKQVTIIDWDVIDICEKEEKRYCNINDCNNIMKYRYNDLCYCVKHAKKSGWNILPKDLMNVDKKKYIELKELYKKYILKEDIFINESYIKDSDDDDDSYFNSIKNEKKINIRDKEKKKRKNKLELYNELLTYISNTYVEEIKKTKVREVSLITLGIHMKERLNNILNDKRIDYVLIENQVSPLANRMKTLQGMITQYFIMKEITDIEWVSASNKLKDYKEEGKEGINYDERKNLGIKVINLLIEKKIKINNMEYVIYDKWIELFRKSKKKDDLADSFLQVLWWCKNKI